MRDRSSDATWSLRHAASGLFQPGLSGLRGVDVWLLLAMVVLQLFSLLVRAMKLGPDSYPIIGVTVALSILAAALALALPSWAIERFGTAARFLEATPARAASGLALVAFAVLATNVFVQQPDAWDENGLLQAVPRIAFGGLAGFESAYRENQWLGPQHPPLPALLHAVIWRLGGSDPVAMRFVGVAFGVATLWIILRIGERLFARRVGLLMALSMLGSPLFVRLASAVTNDIPLLFFFCLALLLCLRLLEKPSDGRAVLLGLVVGLGFLTKYTMVFVIPVLFALVWTCGVPARAWRLLGIACGTVLALLGPWLIAAHLMGALSGQVERVSRLAQVGVRSQTWGLQGLLVRLPSAIGIFSLPLIALGVGRCIRLTRAREGFLLLWLALIVVPVVLTLPVNRFFLPAFPALTALMGLALVDRPRVAARAVLLLGGLCASSLIYYGWVDLGIPLALF